LQTPSGSLPSIGWSSGSCSGTATQLIETCMSKYRPIQRERHTLQIFDNVFGIRPVIDCVGRVQSGSRGGKPMSDDAKSSRGSPRSTFRLSTRQLSPGGPRRASTSRCSLRLSSALSLLRPAEAESTQRARVRTPHGTHIGVSSYIHRALFAKLISKSQLCGEAQNIAYER